MNRYTKLALSLLLTATLSSCERVDNDTISKVTDDVVRTISQAKSEVERLSPKITALPEAELEKLFSFEYAVKDVDSNASSSELQLVLNSYGRERWDCYAVHKVDDGVRLYFKRRPTSYLRYLPQMWP